MKKILLVLKNEIVTLVTRPSFWLGVLGLPLAGLVVFTIAGVINRDAGATQAISQLVSGGEDLRPEGFIDQAEVIQALPVSINPGTFVEYPDEQAGRQALAAGEISALYILPADYLMSGEIHVLRPDFNPLSSNSHQSRLFDWIVRVNLAGGDEILASLVKGPIELEEINKSAGIILQEDDPLKFMIPYASALLSYLLIIGSSTLLLSSLSKEKENRITEVLLMSVTPLQLLSGKILALAITGLGQAVIWMGTGFFILGASGRTFQLPASLSLPVSTLVWGLTFFLLGYVVYASLIAGLGALAPNLREASQAVFIITLPLFIPLIFSSTIFAHEPNGGFAVFLSLFPLSAPVSMMARLPSGGVAWWQPWLAAALLVATSVLVVRLVAAMFRAQTLLSGQSFTIKGYFRALAGK
jgi:ABC-2 type transport system permease protein